MSEILRSDDELKALAEAYIRLHKKDLIETFAGAHIEPDFDPVSIFMAGSPGAGKTEFSIQVLDSFKRQGIENIARIDADEIRTLFPGYIGSNAHIFQASAAKMVHKIHDYVLQKSKSFLLDGTFANQRISFENIERSLKAKRTVVIIYIYQDPKKAWDFTVEREKQGLRRIRKDDFIRQFLESKTNVENAIRQFGSKIHVWLIMKDYNKPEAFILQRNVKSLATYIKIDYSEEELQCLL